MQVLEHLRHNPVNSLMTFGVYPKLSADNLFCNLDYDQIEAKNGDPIVEECRGLVIKRGDNAPFSQELNDSGEFVVVCRPMRRFYNHGLPYAAKIDESSSSAVFMEKLDGSCIKVWWDELNQEWAIGTRGTPKAHTLIGGMHKESQFTFTLLFKDIVKDFEEFSRQLNKEYTYIFELCSPWNQVVVYYKESFIALLAVIHTATGKELNIWTDVPESSFYRKVRKFSLSSATDMIDFIHSNNPAEFEGLVLMDQKTFARVKVKHPGYAAISQLKSSVSASPRNMIEIILLGKLDDASPYLSQEVLTIANKMQENVAAYIRENEELWLTLKPQNLSRKDFAIFCQQNKLNIGCFMNLYTGKYETFKDSFVEGGKQKDGTFSASYLDKALSETQTG